MNVVPGDYLEAVKLVMSEKEKREEEKFKFEGWSLRFSKILRYENISMLRSLSYFKDMKLSLALLELVT